MNIKIATKREYENEIETTAEAVAEAVVDEIRLNEIKDEEEIGEVFARLLHEYTGDHAWAGVEENAIAVLLYAKNPCAEWDTGITPRNATDNFPWADFAGAAIEKDVCERAIELLKSRHHIKIA